MAPKRVTGPAFPPRDPPEGDVTRYLERRLAVRTWPSQAVVTLHVPAEAVADRLWLGMGSLEAVDEATCRLQVGAESPDNLAWLISSIGVEFTLTDPPEVVAAMAALAGRCTRSVGTKVVADPS